MPRPTEPNSKKPSHDWYLKEWMATLRIKQSGLAERIGLSKATMNDVYHGRTQYYRRLVNDVADALNLQPFELFMHPAEAMALRQARHLLGGKQADVLNIWDAIADREAPPKKREPGRKVA